MTDLELKKVFKRRNEVRKGLQDPLFYGKEYDESMEILQKINDILKAFGKKKN